MYIQSQLFCHFYYHDSLCKKCSYSELFWSAFFRIRTKYGEILRIFTAFSRIRTEYGEILRIFTAFFRIRTKYGEILRIVTAFSRIRTEYGSPNAGKCEPE